MTIAAKLSRKLYETFGDEAAETMIDWMQEVDARRAEIRAEIRAEMASFREAMRAEMAAFRDEFRTELHTEIAKLAGRIDARYADLFKWSFAFWIGSTVTLMLGMTAVLRIMR